MKKNREPGNRASHFRKSDIRQCQHCRLGFIQKKEIEFISYVMLHIDNNYVN